MLLGKLITSTINILKRPRHWLGYLRIGGVTSVYARETLALSLLELMQKKMLIEENPQRLYSLHLPLRNPRHFTVRRPEKLNI